MAAGSAIFGFIIGIATVSVVFTLLNAIMVRFACRIIKVDVPKFSRACFVSMLIFVAYIVVSTAVGMVMMLIMQAAMAADGGPQSAAAAADSFVMMQLMSMAMQIIIMTMIATALYKVMIPLATFGRAALVWGITFAFWLVIGIVIYGLLFAYLYNTGYGV